MRHAHALAAAARSVSSLRIASLLPSTTEIIGGLGLQENLVAVTHECDVSSPSSVAELVSNGQVKRVTSSEIDPHAMQQGDIDAAVKNSVRSGLSLYGVDAAKLRDSKADIILTQSLCNVCAVGTADLNRAHASDPGIPVIDLAPTSMQDVLDSFATIATACGHPERAAALQQSFLDQLEALRSAIHGADPQGKVRKKTTPTVLLLEWLEPPFDGGHWVPDQIRAAGCKPAVNTEGGKSKQLSWAEVYESDPDVIVVACCGFDLQRNVEDAKRWKKELAQTRAARTGRLFALDGNSYFARPSQALTTGAALIARCAYDYDEAISSRLDLLPQVREAQWERELPRLEWQQPPPQAEAGAGKAWARLQIGVEAEVTVETEAAAAAVAENSGCDGVHTGIDSEHDCPPPPAWWAKHEQACARGELRYQDPDTGFWVFTELAHAERGRCCGAACRHCTFSHANVAVAARAQMAQVATFLHLPGEDDEPASASADASAKPKAEEDAKVVLFDGRQQDSALLGDGRIVLLTLFDAHTRKVVLLRTRSTTRGYAVCGIGSSVNEIVERAKHLNLPLVGVPLHGATNIEGMVERGVNLVGGQLDHTTAA